MANGPHDPVDAANDITADSENGITTISIRRSHMRNSLDRPSVRALTTAFEQAAEARCIVLRSDGPSFCSGGDLPHLERLAATPDEIRGSIESTFQHLMRTIRSSPVPVIARVQGPAVGAGADLALACDMRIASTEASLREAWIELGVVSALGAPVTLGRAGGPGFALDVLLTGRAVDAAECLSRGLFQRVVDPSALDAAVDEVARLIASRDTNGVRAMRQLVASTIAEEFDRALRDGVDHQERLMRAPEFAVRVRAILDRIRNRK